MEQDPLGCVLALLDRGSQAVQLREPGSLVVGHEQSNLFEALTEMIEGMGPSGTRTGLIGQLVEQIRSQAALLEQFNDPRSLYARLPLEIVVK